MSVPVIRFDLQRLSPVNYLTERHVQRNRAVDALPLHAVSISLQAIIQGDSLTRWWFSYTCSARVN